jgi:hypothetical protein
MTVPRVIGSCIFGSFIFVLGLTMGFARPQNGQEKDAQEKKVEEAKPDTFFAGTVVETTAEKITVSRVVLGKTEKRTFLVTTDTKCEGKLKAKVRVTVRYVTTDDGDRAELIVVRSQQKKTKQN